MSPSTGRIYDRNRTSIALIYASSTARLREESIYDLLGVSAEVPIAFPANLDNQLGTPYPKGIGQHWRAKQAGRPEMTWAPGFDRTTLRSPYIPEH